MSLDGILQFVTEATVPQLTAKQLRYDHRAVTGQVVRANAEKLRQIVLNLFSNAIKFTDTGGTIATACSVADDRVRLEVRDTGRGIAPDELDRIFDPFVQVGQRPSQPTEGTGLGLAISREFARGMGGDLTAESALGRGSVFILSLPAARLSP